MTMTLEDRAKLAVHEVQTQLPGPDSQTEYVLNMLRLAVADEREACAEIALAIDSNRGNEKEIARAIRARGKP